MATGDRQNDNGDQAKAVSPVQTSKSDLLLTCSVIWTKCWTTFPPSLSIPLSLYVRNSGKNMQHSPDYMVLKPFEGGVNFFIQGYLHNLLVKHHNESQAFYFTARCHRSLRKSDSPHKIRLAISTEQPYDVLASSCTCVAGSLGFCHHAVGLMYLVSHYYLTKPKSIPDDLVCTSLPQQWHKPRGKSISSEPLMDMVFKKPKLDTTAGGALPYSPHLVLPVHGGAKGDPD